MRLARRRNLRDLLALPVLLGKRPTQVAGHFTGTLQVQIHFIAPSPEFSVPNGHFSGSLFHFPPTYERRKIYFWGRKISPPPPNLLRRSASRAASVERGKRARLVARREAASVSRFPHVSVSGRLLPQLIGSIPPS